VVIIPRTDKLIPFFPKSPTNAEASLNDSLYKPTIILSEYPPYCTDEKKLENYGGLDFPKMKHLFKLAVRILRL
jgi:hypothetical protein